jgi:hypothetical protein
MTSPPAGSSAFPRERLPAADARPRVIENADDDRDRGGRGALIGSHDSFQEIDRGPEDDDEYVEHRSSLFLSAAGASLPASAARNLETRPRALPGLLTLSEQIENMPWFRVLAPQ